MLVLGANALTAAKNASLVWRLGNSIKILWLGEARSTTRSSPSDFDIAVMSTILSSKTRFRHSVKQGALARTAWG
jgi:hypothetical protein